MMEKPKIKEIVIVEGKYDAILVKSIFDATVVETGGFSLFNDVKKLEMIKNMARSRGIVILTDSDGAGFVIRSKLKGCIPGELIKNAYIPDVPGREPRKARPSREGLLGVEGMTREVLEKALADAGVTALSEAGQKVTKADLYECGLYGRPDSAELRRRLKLSLRLPDHLSVNGLLDAVNALGGREYFDKEVLKIVR